MTMDTFCQSPITTNTQRNIANVPNERRIYLDILAETIKWFKVLTLQSTIKDSAHYNSDEDDAESDAESDTLVATHTSDGRRRKVTDTDTTIINDLQNYWSTGPSQSSSRQLTRRLRMGLRQLEGLCMRTRRLPQRRLSRTRRAAARMLSEILRW